MEDDRKRDIYDLLDLSKLITHSQILIDDDGGSICIYSKVNSDVPDRFVIDREEKDILTACVELLKLVRYLSWLDNSKHSEFRVGIGLDPNSDEEIKKVMDIIGEENYNTLWHAGYKIIKEIES